MQLPWLLLLPQSPRSQPSSRPFQSKWINCECSCARISNISQVDHSVFVRIYTAITAARSFLKHTIVAVIKLKSKWRRAFVQRNLYIVRKFIQPFFSFTSSLSFFLASLFPSFSFSFSLSLSPSHALYCVHILCSPNERGKCHKNRYFKWIKKRK